MAETEGEVAVETTSVETTEEMADETPAAEGAETTESTESTGDKKKGGKTSPKNVYVAHLPYSYTKEQLDEEFKVYGEITESRILVEKWTGASRGVAFVHYADAESAAKAIEATNGKVLKGADKPILVKLAEKKSDNNGPYAGRGGRFGSRGRGRGRGRGYGPPGRYYDDYRDYRRGGYDYYDDYDDYYYGPRGYGPPDGYGPSRRGPPRRAGPYGGGYRGGGGVGRYGGPV